MSYKNKSLWLATAALVLVVHALAAPLAYGQAATFSRLLGTIRDQTGAVVPGVEITATATATNIPHMAVTNDRGDYVIDKLIPGFYDVSAELPGFKTARSLGIRLEVQTVSRVDLVMSPGDISEQVTVTGQSTIIDTDNAEVAAIIEEKKILDLPLAGRDMVKLAYLTTGGTQERQEVGYTARSTPTAAATPPSTASTRTPTRSSWTAPTTWATSRSGPRCSRLRRRCRSSR